MSKEITNYQGIIYLTFGNQDAGVFSSYVTDVCKHLESEYSGDVKVVSFVSMRGFFNTRKRRKSLYSKTIVLPMFPKFRYWKMNQLTLAFFWLFIGRKKVIALSPIAANLGLFLKKLGLVKTVIYDAEGATWAEWNEYDVVGDPKMVHNIKEIESRAVNQSDHNRTVSKKMMEYWQREFGYTGEKPTIIPCTLNSVFIQNVSSEQKIKELRAEWGFTENDVVFVYSGSTAAWQSFDLVDETFTKLLA
ncbi:MAG: hypothetical protein JKY54_01125, partial [Flavobacteriales bacterium]|nr:hypothetical protein [Flavobacteriales bacterium]